MGIFSTKHTDGDNEIAFDFHFPTSKNAIIIFVRNPELGKCKTRLAKTIGNKSALEVYKFLLQHTAQIAQQIKADRFVFYSETIIKNDIWDALLFRKKLQKGQDLGDRMEHAFTELFQLGYKKTIIIGSDLLDLKTEHLDNAFEQLNTHDAIIGPSKDGGYYLLGMKILSSKVFKNKKWSGPTVLKETLLNLKDSKVFMLQELNDIDTFEDIKNHPKLKKIVTNQFS